MPGGGGARTKTRAGGKPRNRAGASCGPASDDSTQRSMFFAWISVDLSNGDIFFSLQAYIAVRFDDRVVFSSSNTGFYYYRPWIPRLSPDRLSAPRQLDTFERDREEQRRDREANELPPIIRKKKFRLHTYTPRVLSLMCSFSGLTFYSIPDSPTQTWLAPAHVRIELNLFAGQLYFDSGEEYAKVCVILALSKAHPSAQHSDGKGWVTIGRMDTRIH
jgi:hypothetical protein